MSETKASAQIGRGFVHIARRDQVPLSGGGLTR
jgi:hypothetical protein